MFDKDSSPVLRRGFIQSSAIGLVASGLKYSNAYNDTKKIETMANKKELLERSEEHTSELQPHS